MFRAFLCVALLAFASADFPVGWKSIGHANCYMTSHPFDHGAEENLNNGEAVLVTNMYDCAKRCAEKADGRFAGCEYVVFHDPDHTCYPRKGLQCAKCDYGGEYSLGVPEVMDTSDCFAPSTKLCVPDAHCSMDRGQCKCCYNGGGGGCDIEELCRCADATTSWNTVGSYNCYMSSRPFDHGAEENLNNGEAVLVTDKDDCVKRCAEQANWQFAGCEYVVFHASDKKCYPRKGLQCAKCDHDGEYSLEVPESMSILECPAPSPTPTACLPDAHCSMDRGQCKCCYNGGCDIEDRCRCADATANWNTVGSYNCYMSSRPFDHGAEENLNSGEAVLVADKDDCVKRCAEQASWQFAACEYVVFHASDKKCYPRKGLQCAKCDHDIEYSLEVPDSMRNLECPTPSPAPCLPDAHCSMDRGQCKCCYNGGCDIEELCRCVESSWKIVASYNCYMSSRPFDHGAEENLNNGEAVFATDMSICVRECAEQADWRFAGCEYVVFHASDQKCYPRKGLQCAKCDYDGAYSLGVPEPMRTIDCNYILPQYSKNFLQAGRGNA